MTWAGPGQAELTDGGADGSCRVPQVRDSVGGHDGQTQATGAGRDGRWPDGLGEDPIGEEPLAERHRVAGLSDHQRNDLCVRSGRLQAFGPEPVTEYGGIRPQALHPLGAFGEQLQSRRCSRHRRGRRSGREDERAGGVDQEVGQLPRAADVGAVAAERLAQGPDDQVDLARQAAGGHRAPAPGPETAGGVGLIDHQPAAMAPRQGRQLPQRRDVPVHGEDAVGDDQCTPARRAAHSPFEVVGVTMPVDEGLGAGEAAAVDDAGVVELVGEDDLTAARQRGDRAGVGQVAGAEEQRGLRALELGQPSLQLRVDRHRAGDQARRARAGSQRQGGIGGRAPQPRVVGQSEVVVGAEQQHRPAVEHDLGALRPVDHTEAPAQPARLELVEALLEVQH